MYFASSALLLGFSAVASAHFHLQFPPPRGLFVEDQEPTFCDGYTTSVDNRTQFPLNNGVVSITSEHPKWTFGVIVSTVQNPTNFANFSQAVPFFQTTGEGPACFPLNLASSGVSGLNDGVNATLQFVFDGGDGTLYQCSDVILSNAATIPSNVSCTNGTSGTTRPVQSASGFSTGAPSGTGSPSASLTSSGSSAPSPTGSGNNNGAIQNSAVSVAVVMSVMAALAATML
ncbi:hypothetical protein QCA50_004403 [Cerrena zonata]|uniref:Copper acquisition factor BIM1-like domain-containing protein n=1 Tax=Cerrena zonata TaxID=2478898 RepID=A0AAW0GTV3_9APHY